MKPDFYDFLPDNPANQLDHNDLVEAEDEADCMTPDEYQEFISQIKLDK